MQQVCLRVPECCRSPARISLQHPFCCRALQFMHALRSHTLSLFALLQCSAVYCFIYFGICIFLICIFFFRANFGSTITNIVIIKIIIQIPEGALLTCMPPTSSASSQILLSQRAQEAKSLGARPPFKSACLRGEKSRVLPTQPPSSAFPLQSPSFAPAASPPLSSPSTYARPRSALPPLPE